MEIKYNTFGKILKGDNAGWFVKFINDQENSGGFFVYEFKNLQGDEGFDTWLEYESDILGYIDESRWKIEWLDN